MTNPTASHESAPVRTLVLSVIGITLAFVLAIGASVFGIVHAATAFPEVFNPVFLFVAEHECVASDTFVLIVLADIGLLAVSRVCCRLTA